MTSYYCEEDNIHQIIPYLYQGDFTARKRSTLLEHGIVHIVNCAGKEYGEVIKWKGDQLGLPFDDDEEQLLFPEIYDAYIFIKKAIERKENVLVHCAMGISRSSAVTMFYLIKTYNITAETALKMVQSKRSCACPNDGFMRQLQAYCLEKDIISPEIPMIAGMRYHLHRSEYD